MKQALPAEVQKTPFLQDGQVLFDAERQLVDSWFDTYPEWCDGDTLVDESILSFLHRIPTWSFFFQDSFDEDKEFLGWYGKDGKSISCNGVKLWLTIHIFHVTGYHRHVGTIADTAADPDLLGWSWKQGERFSRPRQPR